MAEANCVFLWNDTRQKSGWECACCFRFLFFSMFMCHDHQWDFWEYLKEFSFAIIIAFHNSYVLIWLRNDETPLVLSIYFFFDKSLLFPLLLYYLYCWVRFVFTYSNQEIFPLLRGKVLWWCRLAMGTGIELYGS